MYNNPLKNLWFEIQAIPYRTRRAWSLLKWYWSSPDYDYSTLALLMRHHLQRQIAHTKNCGVKSVSWERDCRRMLIVDTLLRRIVDGEEFNIADKRYPIRGRMWAKFVTTISQQDQEMLGIILGKHLKAWWC